MLRWRRHRKSRQDGDDATPAAHRPDGSLPSGSLPDALTGPPRETTAPTPSPARARPAGFPPPLTIELVPETSWGSNVRAIVSPEAWDLIRRRAYRDARYRCQVCGGRGPDHPVECHEQWSYDDHAHVQRLERMVALCPACHEAKHLGHANATGRGARAREHLAAVNGWDPYATDTYIEFVFDQWHERSQHDWTLDLSALTRYGVDPPAPPPAHAAPPAAPREHSPLFAPGPPARTRVPLLEFELSGDEPARGQLIAHPTHGPVVCVRVLRRRPSSSGPPILTIGARHSQGVVDPPVDDEDDEDAGPWHDPQYVEALIDQAARQRDFDNPGAL